VFYIIMSPVKEYFTIGDGDSQDGPPDSSTSTSTALQKVKNCTAN
jgi:hypothetical protein